MHEPIIEQKRKNLAIPLPNFSWQFFLSVKFGLFFVLLILSMLCSYWFFVVHPYLWLNSGRVDALSFQIRSQETGTLSHMIVQEGAQVEKGTVLFSLENSQMQERQKKIKTSLAKLQDQQKFYKNQSDQAMQDYLSDLGVRPQAEIEQHLQMLQESQTKLEEIQKLADALEEEKSSLISHQANFCVAAPCNGTILHQNKIIGDAVQAGEFVLSLVDLSCSWVAVNVPEKKLYQIELGQPVKICLPSYPGQQWEGIVSWIGPATVSKVEGKIGLAEGETIPIKISLPRENFPVKPGLSAKIGIKVH